MELKVLYTSPIFWEEGEKGRLTLDFDNLGKSIVISSVTAR